LDNKSINESEKKRKATAPPDSDQSKSKKNKNDEDDEAKGGKERKLRKAWSKEEDDKLAKGVETFGEGNWALIKQHTGIQRTPAQLSQRWSSTKKKAPTEDKLKQTTNSNSPSIPHINSSTTPIISNINAYAIPRSAAIPTAQYIPPTVASQKLITNATPKIGVQFPNIKQVQPNIPVQSNIPVQPSLPQNPNPNPVIISNPIVNTSPNLNLHPSPKLDPNPSTQQSNK